MFRGKSVIFVVVDRLTKYAHFLALSHPHAAAHVARLYLDHFFKLHGMPTIIISDRDPVFLSSGSILPTMGRASLLFFISSPVRWTD